MVVLKSDYSRCPLKKRPLALPSDVTAWPASQQTEPEDLSVKCGGEAPVAPHPDTRHARTTDALTRHARTTDTLALNAHTTHTLTQHAVLELTRTQHECTQETQTQCGRIQEVFTQHGCTQATFTQYGRTQAMFTQLGRTQEMPRQKENSQETQTEHGRSRECDRLQNSNPLHKQSQETHSNHAQLHNSYIHTHARPPARLLDTCTIELHTPVICTHAIRRRHPFTPPPSPSVLSGQNTGEGKPQVDQKSSIQHIREPHKQDTYAQVTQDPHIQEPNRLSIREHTQVTREGGPVKCSPHTPDLATEESAASDYAPVFHVMPGHLTPPKQNPHSFLMQTNAVDRVGGVVSGQSSPDPRAYLTSPLDHGPISASQGELNRRHVEGNLLKLPLVTLPRHIPEGYPSPPGPVHPHRPWLTEDPPRQIKTEHLQFQRSRPLPTAQGLWAGVIPFTWPLPPLPTPLAPPSLIRHARECRSPGSDSASSDGSSGGRGEARYSCAECGKSYSTFSGLSKHKQFHCSALGTKSFACKHCDKVYTSLGALKMHIRTHTLPCKCQLCGKAFSRPWLLQGHIRTHTGEKPFQCSQCDRCFADRSNLRAHLQTHAHVKKYACGTCHKTFSRMSLLNKHSEAACPSRPQQQQQQFLPQ